MYLPGERVVASDAPDWAKDKRKAVPYNWYEEAFLNLLYGVEGDGANRDGLKETPKRAAKAWIEKTDGYGRDPSELFKTFESDGYDEMVVVRDIEWASTCEHHLVPFFGHAHVAYIAQGRIIGLSKIPRLVDLYAHRLQTQERITMQVADALEKYLEPAGVAVVLQARHMCMECRGVKKSATTMTSVTRGAMRDKAAARGEFLRLIGVQ